MGSIVDVVDWPDDFGDQIVVRFPPAGQADLKLGSQLIVRESQSAVFFRDGKAYDVFGPGRHTLTTANLPLLSSLLNLATGETPFKAEVYFVNMKLFRNMKWGTHDPIPYRDSDLGMVRLRSYGTYTMIIIDPQLFVNKVVGVEQLFTTSSIDDFLRNIIVSRFADSLGEVLKNIFDLPTLYDEIGIMMKTKLKTDFDKYGIEIRDFFISAITPPPEVEKAIDERAGMGAIGDMNKYMMYKSGKAMEEAAKTEGSGAGTGVGLGAGLGMGMMMTNMMTGAGGTGTQQTINCPKCQAVIPANSKFCQFCGAEIKPVSGPQIECPKCGTPNPADAKFCSECGSDLTKIGMVECPKCSKPIPEGSKFCPYCGEKIG